MFKTLIELLYPPRITCLICGKDLAVETRYSICPNCELTSIKNFCQCCGVEISGAKSFCDHCFEKDRAFDMARAPFCFKQDNVRKLIYGLKYGDKTYLARYMAEYMTDVFVKTGWEIDIVTYIPIHKRKYTFVRGYNQAELIAREFAKINELDVAPLLEKKVYSKKSTARMGRSERAKTLEGSFEVIGDVKKKNILIIDDVFTTGATTQICAQELKIKRANKVYVLTFATSKEKLPLYTYETDDEELIRELIKNKQDI